MYGHLGTKLQKQERMSPWNMDKGQVGLDSEGAYKGIQSQIKMKFMVSPLIGENSPNLFG